MSTSKNFAKVPSDKTIPSNGGYALSVAKTVDDSDGGTEGERRLVARALREAATFADDDATPLRHLLSSCYCIRAALNPALVEASRHGNSAGVQLLLAANASPDDCDAGEGKSALHVACEAGDEAVARLLVAHSPSGLRSSRSALLNGRTPLDVLRDNDLGGLARRLEAYAVECGAPSPPPSPPADDGDGDEAALAELERLQNLKAAQEAEIAELEQQRRILDGEVGDGEMPDLPLPLGDAGDGEVGDAGDGEVADMYDGKRNANGKRHGYGVWTNRRGRMYDGEWNNGRRHGKGKMVYDNGSVYEGQFENGLRHGEGRYTVVLKDGTEHDYRGEWRNGKMHGLGFLFLNESLGIYHPEYRYYEGQWKDGNREGYGKYVYNHNGFPFIYEGQFKENVYHGEGTIKSVFHEATADGEEPEYSVVYSGRFEHGKKPFWSSIWWRVFWYLRLVWDFCINLSIVMMALIVLLSVVVALFTRSDA